MINIPGFRLDGKGRKRTDSRDRSVRTDGWKKYLLGSQAKGDRRLGVVDIFTIRKVRGFFKPLQNLPAKYTHCRVVSLLGKKLVP